MPTRWRGSLLLRLSVGALLAGVLATAATSWVLVRDAEIDTEARGRQVLLQDATRSAGSLTQRIVERQRSLRAAAEELDQPDQWDASGRSHPALRVMFDALLLADRSGQVIHREAPADLSPSLEAPAVQAGFESTMREGRPMVWVVQAHDADVHATARHASAGDPVPSTVVMLTQPVIRQGEIRAVLGGVLRLNQEGLMREVSEMGLDLGEGSISQLLAVTDGQGRHLVDGVIGQDQIGVEARQDLALAMARWRDQGSPVEPEGLVWTEQDQIVVAAGIPGPDWVVWRRYSRDTLLEPLNAMRSRSMHWALGLWGGLSLLLLLYLGWQLHPLALLERRVVAMLDGAQDPHAGWPQAGGEIGALSATLNSVALALADKQAENLRLLEQLESLMAAAPLGLAFVREDRLTLVNAELGRLLGYAPRELEGLPVQLLMADPDESARMTAEMRAALAEGRAYEGEHRFLRRQGSTFWGQVHASQVRAGQPEAGAVWTLGDITAQVTSRHQLEWSATHDALTGLLNRRGFEERMARFVEGRLRRPAALLIIDLDHFKPINDSAGHQAGDAMLQAIARVLNDGVRASDAVGRLGGDEFAVLLEGCPSQWAQRLAQKLLERVRDVEVSWNGRRLQVSASIGLAMWDDSMGSPHHWIHAADLACYEAKRAGRANVQASAAEPVGEALPG